MMSDSHQSEAFLFGSIWAVFMGLTLLIAVGPALQVQSRQQPVAGSEPMSDLEERGLKVYVDEGCAYCHTQQVRPVAMDESLGRPSAPGDYARLERLGIWRQTPAVLGSERTGPDLTTIGERQPSQQWHYMHLYNPRAVVEASMMPAFPWLFRVAEDPPEEATTVSLPGGYGPSEGKVVPNERGEALVAYLTSLKQDPLPGASEGGSGVSTDSSASEGESASTGASLYASKCASCHQSDGSGVPGTFPPLRGDPVVTAEDPSTHIEIVLGGLKGKTIRGTSYAAAMPGFGDSLSDQQAAAVINHERTSWGNQAPRVTAEEVKKIRRMLESADEKGSQEP